MHRQCGWFMAAQLKWKEKAMIAKGSTSVKGCGDSLRPFVPCDPSRLFDRGRRAFFYLLRGEKAMSLPKRDGAIAATI